MRFDWITFGLQALNVLILLAILRHFLFRPVAEIIARRKAEAEKAMEEAERARDEARRAAEEARAEASATAAQRIEALAQARQIGEAQKAEILDEARGEARKLLAAATAEAEAGLSGSRDRQRDMVRDLALAVTRRVLAAQPQDRALAGYAARLADALAAMPAARREALLPSSARRLVAPRAPTDAEAAEIRAAVARFGLDDAPIEVDPTLVAGLEVHAGAGVLRNSIAHDLDRIADALAGKNADERD